MTPNHFTASEDLNRRVSQSLGFLVGVGLALGGAFCLVTCVAAGPDELPGSLEARINPNSAPVASLARLPGIGWTRAQTIVVYRERVYEETGDRVAFRSPGDLQQIRGIGPKTVAGLLGWLRFD